ncbi:hypothetical protein ACPA9J_17250 [Pseudomonas aeruginosa]
MRIRRRRRQAAAPVAGHRRREVTFSGIKSAYPDPSALKAARRSMWPTRRRQDEVRGVRRAWSWLPARGGQEIYPLSPDSGAGPGQRVK